MKFLNPNRILFYTFIIGSLYFIQLSSQSESLSNYTSLFWIIFMIACLGLYLFRKNNSDNDDSKDKKEFKNIIIKKYSLPL